MKLILRWGAKDDKNARKRSDSQSRDGSKKRQWIIRIVLGQPIWTRILTWGRDYQATREYVKKNELETEGVIIYYRAPKPKKKAPNII
jgi:hypothetical protein